MTIFQSTNYPQLQTITYRSASPYYLQRTPPPPQQVSVAKMLRRLLSVLQGIGSHPIKILSFEMLTNTDGNVAIDRSIKTDFLKSLVMSLYDWHSFS